MKANTIRYQPARRRVWEREMGAQRGAEGADALSSHPFKFAHEGGEDEAGEGGKETEMFATGKVRDFARLFIPGFPHIPASWKALASLATQERGEGWGRKRNGRMDREDFSFSLRFGANLSARQWLRIFLFVFFFRVFWGEFWLVLDLLFGVSGILVGVRFVSKRIRNELKVMEEEAEDFIRLLSRYWPSFCGQPFARWLLVKFRLEGSTSFQGFHDK